VVIVMLLAVVIVHKAVIQGSPRRKSSHQVFDDKLLED